jgi:hypothetical protein
MHLKVRFRKYGRKHMAATGPSFDGVGLSLFGHKCFVQYLSKYGLICCVVFQAATSTTYREVLSVRLISHEPHSLRSAFFRRPPEGSLFIPAHEAADCGSRTETGDIHRHVCAAAGAVNDAGTTSHRYLSLRRNALDPPLNVLVQRDIADDKNSPAITAILYELNRTVKNGFHF